MTQLFTAARTRLSQHRAYTRTLHELRSLPIEMRIDLDIAGIEDKVAARAVYGA